MPGRIVVCDTGPLIALALVELLPALPRLFAEVVVPPAVVAEAIHDLQRPGAKAIAAAMAAGCLVQRPINLTPIYQDLAEILDRGEAEALALADELNAVALIDERRGRKVAAQRGIAVTGTAAVLILAKRRGEVSAIQPLLERLTTSGYRLSPALIADVLRLCGER